MKSNILPDWLKFLLVMVICGVGGFLSAAASGQITDKNSIIQNGAYIAIAGSAIYGGVFKGLNLEKVLYPRASVISGAMKSVSAQIGLMSHDTICAAVDPKSSTSIRVLAQSFDGDSSGEEFSIVPRG